MKKFLLIILLVLLAVNVYAQDSKLTGLSDISSPAAGDDMYIVDDPDGTAVSKKISISALLGVATDLDAGGAISANAVALTTDTTGNYAAGDAEAGNALTGDSATSFFSSGTIENTRLPAASTSASGISELAITAEIDAGTDSTRAMPVDQFVASKRNIKHLVFVLVEKTTDITTATNIAGDFLIDIAGTILQSDSAPFHLYATNSTAGSNTGTGLVIDISLNGTTIMTTNKLAFDSGEKTTTTAATPPDLTDTTIAIGDILTIDVDSVHDGTVAKGLTIYMAIRE